MLLLVLLACSAGAGPTDDGGDSAAGDSGDSGGGDTSPGCATVTPGDDWAWDGGCPQMPTPVVIEVDGCALTLDYAPFRGMTMGMPYSGTIEGDTVTFADDNSVDGCVGAVEDADTITGSCTSGCTFELTR